MIRVVKWIAYYQSIRNLLEFSPNGLILGDLRSQNGLLDQKFILNDKVTRIIDFTKEKRIA